MEQHECGGLPQLTKDTAKVLGRCGCDGECPQDSALENTNNHGCVNLKGKNVQVRSLRNAGSGSDHAGLYAFNRLAMVWAQETQLQQIVSSK